MAQVSASSAQNVTVTDTQTIEDLFEYLENNSDYTVFYQNGCLRK